MQENAFLTDMITMVPRLEPIHSIKEGYINIQAVMDELWSECKRQTPLRPITRIQLVRIAAQAWKIAQDLQMENPILGPWSGESRLSALSTTTEHPN